MARKQFSSPVSEIVTPVVVSVITAPVAVSVITAPVQVSAIVASVETDVHSESGRCYYRIFSSWPPGSPSAKSFYPEAGWVVSRVAALWIQAKKKVSDPTSTVTVSVGYAFKPALVGSATADSMAVRTILYEGGEWSGHDSCKPSSAGAMPFIPDHCVADEGLPLVITMACSSAVLFDGGLMELVWEERRVDPDAV